VIKLKKKKKSLNNQFLLPCEIEKKSYKKRYYKSILTISENPKGVLDIDTVKG